MASKKIKVGADSQTTQGSLPPSPPPIVIFDTTGAPINDSAGFIAQVGGLISLGQSFSTEAGTFVLEDLKLDLADAVPSDGGTLTVKLYSDNGSPGPNNLIATLGTILDSSLTAANQLIDVPITDGPTLAGGTRYWIELTATNGPLLINGATWDATNTPAGTTEGAAEYNLRLTADNIVDAVSADTTLSGDFAFGMQVSVESTCYAAGTHILTARGEVPVEALRVGDRVMALRRGGLAEISWIGHRDVMLSHHARPRDINPIRITAGAFGPSLPHRDLILSPDHALFVDGALIAARYLLNGATIVQEAPERITYYHVELAQHEILLAEGLGAESFLDVGNRHGFANGGGPLVLHPDFAPSAATDPAEARLIWDQSACAPSLSDPAARAALHRTLLDRAFALGHATTEDAALHLLAGGRSVYPTTTARGVHFRLPAGVESVQIISNSVVPSEIGLPSNDGRRLGVGVTNILVGRRRIENDDPRLLDGWHEAEPGLRWTNGAALLATGGARSLTLQLHPGLRYWTTPKPEARRLAA